MTTEWALCCHHASHPRPRPGRRFVRTVNEFQQLGAAWQWNWRSSPDTSCPLSEEVSIRTVNICRREESRQRSSRFSPCNNCPAVLGLFIAKTVPHIQPYTKPHCRQTGWREKEQLTDLKSTAYIVPATTWMDLDFHNIKNNKSKNAVSLCEYIYDCDNDKILSSRPSSWLSQRPHKDNKSFT